MSWPAGWEAAAERVLDGCVLLFGCWTLLCWTLQFLGASFATLVALSGVALAAAVAAARLLPAADTERAAAEREAAPARGEVAARDGAAAAGSAVAGEAAAVSSPLSPRTLALAMAGAGGVLAVQVASGSYVAWWALGVGLLLCSLWLRRRPGAVAAARGAEGAARGAAAADRGRRREGGSMVWLAVVAAVAVAATLVAHRPDADDSFYVNLIVNALDRPGDALLAHDGLYGEPGLPPFETWYRLKSYEPLLATVSRLSGADPKELYYLVFPALFALLLVVADWAALREMGGGGGAALGAAAVVLALLAWGDGHQTFGNFAFVRLFQGKAVAVAVGVPAAVYYAARFCRAPGVRGWVLLALVQVAALGISGSAVVAVPATALLLVAAWSAAGRRPRLLWGLAAALPVAAFAAVVAAQLPVAQRLAASASWADVAQLPGVSAAGLTAVLGSGPRSTFALFALLLAPLLAPPGRRAVWTAYVLALLLAVVNPLIPALAGRVLLRFGWRVFWAVPFPLFLGFCVQRLSMLRFGSARAPAPRELAPAALAACAFGLLFAFLPGRWTLSPADGTWLARPSLKVPPEHALAGDLVVRTRQTDLVLAPFEVAEWVTTYRHRPRLLAVRAEYYGAVAGEGPGRLAERRRLESLVRGPGPEDAAELAADLPLVASRGVDVVVSDACLPWHAALAAGLTRLGCAAAPPLSPRYDLWRCPRRPGA